MKKNYYNSNDLKFLNTLISDVFISHAYAEYLNMLKSLTHIQQQKFNLITNNDSIKYFLTFIDYHPDIISTPPYNLYDIHCSDFNKYDGENNDITPNRSAGDVERDLLITKINDLVETNTCPSLFTNTVQYLKNIQIDYAAAGYIHYYPNAQIKTHHHNPDTMMLHVLLHDVNGGSLNVHVNGEHRLLSEKGDLMCFETMNDHGALYTGKEELITFSMGLTFSKLNINQYV